MGCECGRVPEGGQRGVGGCAGHQSGSGPAEGGAERSRPTEAAHRAEQGSSLRVRSDRASAA